MIGQLQLGARTIIVCLVALAVGTVALPVHAQEEGTAAADFGELMPTRKVGVEQMKQQTEQLLERLKEEASTTEEKEMVGFVNQLYELRKDRTHAPRLNTLFERRLQVVRDSILGPAESGVRPKTFDRIESSETVYAPSISNPELNFDYTGRPTPAGDLNGDGNDDYVYLTPAPEFGLRGVPDDRGSEKFDRTPKTAVYFGRPGSPRREPDQVFYARIRPVGDLNGDGFDDAVVFESEDGTTTEEAARFYYGTSSGYQKGNTIVDLGIPDGAAFTVESFGDLDGDGYDDVLLYPEGGFFDQALVVYGAPEFIRDARLRFYEPGGSFDGGEVAKMADLDGDGEASIVTTTRDNSSIFNPQAFESQVRIFDINEDRELVKRQEVSLPEGYLAIEPNPVDLAGDGSLNLLTESFVVSGDRILSPTEANPDSFEVGSFTYEGAPAPVGDLNGDGRDDFLKYDLDNERWFLSYTPEAPESGLSFDQPIPESSGEDFPIGENVNYLDQGIGDVNGDGVDDAILDYVKFEPGTDEGAVALGQRFVFGSEDGSPSFTTTSVPIEQTADQVISTTNVGDVNGDGTDDFAINRFSAREVQIYFGRPSLQSSPDLTLNAPTTSGQVGVESGDFNGDGFSDIVLGEVGARRVHLYSGGPDMDGSPDVTLNAFALEIGPDPQIEDPVNIGDVNGDGIDDLLVTASPEPLQAAFLGAIPIFDQGLVFFGGDSLPTTPDQVLQVPGEFRASIDGLTGIGDMNEDGLDDFALGVPSKDKVYVFTGDQDPTFSFETASFVIETPRSVFQNVGADFGDPFFGVFGLMAGGDFNGDGAADLAIGGIPTNGAPGVRIPVWFGGSNADAQFDRVLDVPSEPLSLPSGGGFGPSPSKIANGDVRNLTATPDVDRDGAEELLLGTRGTGAALYTSVDATDTPVILEGPNPDAGGLGENFFVSQEDAVGDFNADGTTDFVLVQTLDNTDFNVSSQVYRYDASSIEASGTPIEPVASGTAAPGEQFSVDVRIGSGDTPVQDLFSASFQLQYDPSRLSIDGGSAGSLMGDDAVFTTDDSESGVVDVGVSRKDGEGTVDGSGIVGTLEFSVADDAPEGTSLSFRLTAVEAKDKDGNQIDLKTGTDQSIVYPSSVEASVSQAPEGSYRLVALPGEVDRSLSDQMSGTHGVGWEAYWDTGARKDPYVTFDGTETFNMKPGNGFWITGSEEFSIDESLPTVDLNAQNEAVVDVHGGWNIISNPLDRDVRWAALQDANGEALQPLWSYQNGSYARADSFKSAKTGQAYYFLNNRGLDSLRIPYPLGIGKEKSREKETPKRSVRLTVLKDGASVSAITVGSGEEAEDGRGPYDFVAPPAKFQETSLRVQSSAESSSGDRQKHLAAEFRSPSANGHRFDLVLSSSSLREPVTIRAEELNSVDDREVVLIDQNGEAHDLRATSAVRIVPNQEKTALKLVVGKTSLVEKAESEAIPDRLRLLDNYPNPFSEQTTIKYDLPEPKNVEVAVYDMLGRRVKTLVNQRQKPGSHRVRWSAQSDNNQPVSSGIYFVRLETESTQLVQKLVVVR